MLPVPSLDDRATPLLRSRIKLLFRHLPKALGGEEEAIHQMRVAGRRLRVGLPLLVAKPEARRVVRARRGTRKLVRTAGAGRDLDVGLGLFEKWTADREISGEARFLLRRLRAARTRSRHRLAEDLLDLHLSQLRGDLRRIIAQGGIDVLTVLDRFRAARDDVGNRLLAALAAAGDRFDPVALHAVRRRVRRLRYIAEIGSEVLREAPSEASLRLKKLQEALGGIHDAWVLSEWFGRQKPGDILRGRAAVAAEAGSLQATFVELSRTKHESFLRDVPARELRQTLALMGRETFAA